MVFFEKQGFVLKIQIQSRYINLKSSNRDVLFDSKHQYLFNFTKFFTKTKSFPLFFSIILRGKELLLDTKESSEE